MLKIFKETLPKYHPTIAFLHHKLGLIYLGLKDKIAIEHFEASLTIHQRLTPPNFIIINELQLTLNNAQKKLGIFSFSFKLTSNYHQISNK